MTALSISQSLTAINAACTASFQAAGGTPPYTYSVTTAIPGGTINSSTGVYIAPPIASSNPKTAYDTIKVTDNSTPTRQTVTTQILVGTPLLLFCDIIQMGMGLPNGRVYLWNQKLFQPTDAGLYIAISNPRNKVIGNVNDIETNGSGMTQGQYVTMMAVLNIDVISRGPEARDQKEGVILALKSVYAQQQQTSNSFFIGTIPQGTDFIDLSSLDGAAIPYRYQISIKMQYGYALQQAAPFYSSFQNPQIATN